MCSPFASPQQQRVVSNDFAAEFQRVMAEQRMRQPIKAPPLREPPASRIIPRKVPGMEDRMSFWDYIFPARRRKREEERRQAMPQRAYAAHVANTRQASPDTSFDLTSPLNLMSPLHPFNPMNPINLGASFHVPSASASSHGEPSSHSSGGSDSGSSYSGSSDSGGSSSGSGE